MPFSRQLESKIQSSIVRGGRVEGNRCISTFPRRRDRKVVLGTGINDNGEQQDRGTHKDLPTPATPDDWCVTARHRFPTGTGPTATHPLSRSLGSPSLLESTVDQGSSEAISSNSAYMHLSAHLLVLLFLLFRFFLGFLNPSFGVSRTEYWGSLIGSVAESGVTSCSSMAAYGATDASETPMASLVERATSSSSDAPRLRSAKRSSCLDESTL
jgi:hypothetical protein